MHRKTFFSKASFIMILAACTSCHGDTSITRKFPFLSPLAAAPATFSSPLGVVVPTTRCGGVGTPLQTRISGCEGYCRFQAGQPYDCEKDFVPSTASQSLSLMVETCTPAGFCIIILDVELPNSSVQPGFIYTAKYTIVPNDILSGQTILFRATLYHTLGRLIEVCVSATADIL